MTDKTIREFLTERGQDPADFAKILGKNDGYLTKKWGCFGWWIYTIVDIKRCGDMVVVLEHFTLYPDGGGEEREIRVTVYPDTIESVYHAKELYYKSGYSRLSKDHLRDLHNITRTERMRDKIRVYLEGGGSVGVLDCTQGK